MAPKFFVLLLFLGGCQPPGDGASGRDEGRPPNILFILADDLGWKDVGYNGSHYASPNIDRLAAGGMIFSQAYAASPTCSPTRASILTGRHPARIGLTRAIRIRDYQEQLEEGGDENSDEAASNKRWIEPESLSYLPESEPSLARALESLGFDTGFIGKWHLGLPPHTPHRFGFDHTAAVGFYSACSYFAPYKSFLNVPDAPFGEYLTERLTDEAVRFLRKERERPFFLFLSHFAVHGPWQAPPLVVARLQKTLDPTSPQANATYAAMIEGLDDSVGRLLLTLEELGELDNTIVVFASDNGPTLRKQEPLTSVAPLRGGKQELYEGGIRVPLVVSWPSRIEPNSVSEVPVSSVDFFPTLVSLAGGESAEEGDGVDLSGVLLERDELSRESLYFHMPHRSFTSAIRSGDLKLIHRFRGGDELYDLSADIGEENDLANERPEDAARLRGELFSWLQTVEGGIPRRNPDQR